jgi:2-polyprenyl-3-methyl-5-hydroxy-6-metoxy-1,4-benzoquinol methylase
VTAIDASHEMISEARRETDDYSVSFVESDLEHFTSPEPFDVVIALSVLEYLPNSDAALERLTALSRNLLVITVPNRNGMVRRMERAALWLRRLTSGKMFRARGAYLEHQRKQWKPAELDRDLAHRGFERIDHTFVGTAFELPPDILPVFEHAWWAALYCGVYRRRAAQSR